MTMIYELFFSRRRGLAKSERQPKPARRLRPWAEVLEDRLAPATSAFYSMPTNLVANAGATVNVPITIDHLFDNAADSGLAAADIVLTYDPANFTVATTDISEGTLIASRSWGTFNTSVDTANGEIHISTNAKADGSNDVVGPVGGVIANVNFHVLANPTHPGPSTINVIVNGGAVTAPDNSVSHAFDDINVNEYTLNPPDQVNGVIDVIGQAAKLAFVQQPTATVGGQTITPPVKVAIEDAGGNIISTDTSKVTLAIGNNPAGGTLSGTIPATAVNGVATFNDLKIDNAGTGYTLVATDGTLTSATSNAFDIVSAQATIVGNTLQIVGDDTANNITVRLAAGDPTTTVVQSGGTSLGSFSNANFNAISVSLNGGDDSLTLDNSNGSPIPGGGVSYNGGAGNDTFVGPATDNVWAISGTNTGTLNNISSFTNVEMLQGSTGTDRFTFSPAGSLSGWVDGGTGAAINTLDYSGYNAHVTVQLRNSSATALHPTSTGSNASGGFGSIQSIIGSNATNNLLVGSNADTTWSVTGANSGTAATATSSVSFSAFQDLTGGSGADTFKLVGTGRLDGPADGGAGANTLDYSGYSNRVIVSFAAYAATGIKNLHDSGIARFQTIIGSASTNNLMVGSNADSIWDITGNNAGTVFPTVYGQIAFSAFAYLTGGFGADTFKMEPAANITGALDGRLTGLANTLDYSNYTGHVVVSLAGNAATGVNSQHKSSVFDFQNFKGNNFSTSLFVGPNIASTWSIATGSGSLNNGALTFNGFPNLTGGSANNVFAFQNGATVAGTVDGGTGGINTLDFSAWTAGVTVNLSNNTASNGGPIVGKLADFRNVLGGSGNDTLIGNSLGGILVGNGGVDTITGGSGRSVLIGGAGNDTVRGGISGDLIIAGTTSFDANLPALLAILAEWQRTDADYATRVNDLRTGVGTNNSVKLVFGTTVLDDGGSNKLTGDTSTPTAGELDWFFANTAAGHDTITGLQTGEQIN